MTEHKPRNAFDIPKLFYFEAKNIHSGSRGKLRYRVCPEGGELLVAVWRQDLCYELVMDQLEGEAAFPMTEDGFNEMIQWLSAEYEKA